MKLFDLIYNLLMGFGVIGIVTVIAITYLFIALLMPFIVK